MLIYIPTYKRVDKQVTLHTLMHAWNPEKIWLVARPEEERALRGIWPNVLVCVKKGVPAARQAAIEHAADKGVMRAFFFDDDLKFAVREPEWCFQTGDTKLVAASHDDLKHHLAVVELKLNPWLPMLGFDARSGNNRKPERRMQYQCRIMRAFGVHVPTLTSLGIRFDAFPFWEDFHVALSLLEHGKPIANLTTITNDAATNTAGGCSTYRNVEALQKCQKAFAKAHPCAKPVLKKAKSWGGGMAEQEVPDFVIYWQKAAKAGGVSCEA